MRKTIFLLALAFVLGNSQSVQAQYYNTSIGLRVGPNYGFTIKHFFTQNFAFEGLVSSRYLGVTGTTPSLYFTGLAEWHFPIGRQTGFQWFIGPGVHAGYTLNDNGSGPGVLVGEGDTPGTFLMGFDLIGGVQYTFPNIPLTLQVDYKPGVNLFQKTNFIYDEVGISARFTF